MLNSYKVLCWDTEPGHRDYNPAGHANALRFVDKLDAEVYGKALFMRWTALKRWEIAESEDAPNKVFWHGSMLELFVAKRYTLNGFFDRERRYGFDALKIALERFLTKRTSGWREVFAIQARDGIIAFEFHDKDSRMQVVKDARTRAKLKACYAHANASRVEEHEVAPVFGSLADGPFPNALWKDKGIPQTAGDL